MMFISSSKIPGQIRLLVNKTPYSRRVSHVSQHKLKSSFALLCQGQEVQTFYIVAHKLFWGCLRVRQSLCSPLLLLCTPISMVRSPSVFYEFILYMVYYVYHIAAYNLFPWCRQVRQSLCSPLAVLLLLR